ncbi:YlbF family regulator [Cohnella panacarvi]|uniref:YlbF family regulator n=1 Tax=Cohnella panacarvi TaxID=400776 RepID=UPI000479774E|nr:YlbF family regulator [Cohnella panacarvi]
MIVKLDADFILDRMESLCSELLEQSSYKALRQSISTFVTDEAAMNQYERFLEHSNALQSKQERNIALLPAEVESFEQEERALYDNEAIRKFLYAEREFSRLQNLINLYFAKTLELNRLPLPGELKAGGCGCGGSCGSSH